MAILLWLYRRQKRLPFSRTHYLAEELPRRTSTQVTEA
jgi:hypothetical protein